jgi:adenylate cyclase
MVHRNDERPSNCLAACVITDAERYTGLTEAMEPSAVVELVNRYFDALFQPVLENGGFISDVKGDGVLAVWNYESAGAQLKALVCKACLEMVSRVDVLNCFDPEHRLPTRVGVDFGPVALAHVGARHRFEFRAVGDPVNTASRLQELNKQLRTLILVSDTFAHGVSGFLFRDLGSFQLRGKRNRTRVKELVGALETCTAEQIARCNEFARAVSAFESGDGLEARRRFLALQSAAPDDGPTLHYLQRLQARPSQPEYPASRSWIGQLWGARQWKHG